MTRATDLQNCPRELYGDTQGPAGGGRTEGRLCLDLVAGTIELGDGDITCLGAYSLPRCSHNFCILIQL